MRRPLTLVLALALAVVPGARALAAPVAQVQLDVDGDGRPDSLSVTEDGKPIPVCFVVIFNYRIQ